MIIEEQFPNINDGWECEKFQREKILDGIKDANEDDYIIYSDSDEIPDLTKLSEINHRKKYVAFCQKMFMYKLNLQNLKSDSLRQENFENDFWIFDSTDFLKGFTFRHRLS